MPSSHLILCHPLLLLPSNFPNIRVFSNKSSLLIRLPKDWSFSFNISLSKEYSGLISYRIDWLDLLAVQGTLKSLLQHHSSKASTLRHSVFFMVWLLHPFMTRTFVGKVMSLLFKMLSRFVIAFLPRSNCFLIVYMCTYVYDMYDLYVYVWYVYICDVYIHVICKYIHIVEYYSALKRKKLCHLQQRGWT